MLIQKGDRFYSEYHEDFGTVVNYKSWDDWYFRLDKQPGNVYRSNTTPNKMNWVQCNNNRGD